MNSSKAIYEKMRNFSLVLALNLNKSRARLWWSKTNGGSWDLIDSGKIETLNSE